MRVRFTETALGEIGDILSYIARDDLSLPKIRSGLDSHDRAESSHG